MELRVFSHSGLFRVVAPSARARSLVRSAPISCQTRVDFSLLRTKNQRPPEPSVRRAEPEYLSTRHPRIFHDVKQPENAMAFHAFVSGQFPKLAVCGQQKPFTFFREREGNAVRQRECRALLAIAQRVSDPAWPTSSTRSLSATSGEE